MIQILVFCGFNTLRIRPKLFIQTSNQFCIFFLGINQDWYNQPMSGHFMYEIAVSLFNFMFLPTIAK